MAEQNKPAWLDLYRDRSQWDSLQYNDPRLDEYAQFVEQKLGLPPGTVLALKNAGERTPKKPGEPWARSPKGAQGVMQFMPATIEAFPHDPENPFENIYAAGLYMQNAIKQYRGNVAAAFADYNGGPRQARPVVEGQRPPARETFNYLVRVKRYLMQHAAETTAAAPRASGGARSPTANQPSLMTGDNTAGGVE